ncbi:hypothetical protein ANCCEY_09561 [Ancylostoma ceylanicum]|uniref:SXP/RAL-2 family protein Ani s 5-like cation-binding domain-containing protein n=1 Tax=Ancylostoma ceylanicum TaxID=53326 RepID=A0A0D6LJK5_9BILA|nr:hypothetical protein ANCCEY_09561 [Ancylostoma ceylanicum]
MPAKARSEFEALAGRQTLAWKEKERLMLEWAEKHAVKDKMKAFIDDMMSKRKAKEKAFFELIEKLPALGKEYMEFLNGIETPRKEKVAKWRKFMDDHAKEFEVLIFAAGQFRPRRGGPRRGSSRNGKKVCELLW